MTTCPDARTPGCACMAQNAKTVDEAAVLAKVNRNVLPFFCCLAMLCYLDRVNLAFAARQLNDDLGFSKAVYGLGSGVSAAAISAPLSVHNLGRLNPERCTTLVTATRQVFRRSVS